MQPCFDISEKVVIGLAEDTRLATASATGTAVTGLAEAFERLKPDIVLVLGDRFEIFAEYSLVAMDIGVHCQAQNDHGCDQRCAAIYARHLRSVQIPPPLRRL